MEFVVNDCSLHGQFNTATAFIDPLTRLLAVRNRVERSSYVVRCPRRLLDTAVGPDLTLPKVLGALDKNLRHVLLAWLANKGPFWDDDPLHGPDDWFEVNGNIVTDTGLGEAAMAAQQGLPRSILSFDPSSWTYTPIRVAHHGGVAGQEPITLDNLWALTAVEQYLRDTRPPLTSWHGLVRWAREECPHLTLTSDVIRWLDGHPFIPGAAERFQVLLRTLNTIKGSFGESGALTSEGMHLHQNHFVGKKAWFTDSSDNEKIVFDSELTFPNPEAQGSTLLCSWHGKVKIEQMRMHFTYPIRHDRPLYVVYIGPKLTRR